MVIRLRPEQQVIWVDAEAVAAPVPDHDRGRDRAPLNHAQYEPVGGPGKPSKMGLGVVFDGGAHRGRIRPQKARF